MNEWNINDLTMDLAATTMVHAVELKDLCTHLLCNKFDGITFARVKELEMWIVKNLDKYQEDLDKLLTRLSATALTKGNAEIEESDDGGDNLKIVDLRVSESDIITLPDLKHLITRTQYMADNFVALGLKNHTRVIATLLTYGIGSDEFNDVLCGYLKIVITYCTALPKAIGVVPVINDDDFLEANCYIDKLIEENPIITDKVYNENLLPRLFYGEVEDTEE